VKHECNVVCAAGQGVFHRAFLPPGEKKFFLSASVPLTQWVVKKDFIQYVSWPIQSTCDYHFFVRMNFQNAFICIRALGIGVVT
jgi:hypothetical protein